MPVFEKQSLLLLFQQSTHERKQKSREDENENYNNNDNYDYGNYQNWEMNEEERLAYHQSVISYTSLALAAVFVFISILISREGANLPEIEEALWDTNNDGAGEVHNTREMEVARLAHSAAHLEMLSNVWNFLSTSTIVILMVLLIATLFSLGGEDAERMKEEGQVYNLIAVLFWVAIVSFGIRFVGRQILGEKKWGGTMGVGVLSGATTNFSALLFMVFLLYSNPMFEERRPEDGPATSVALSFASLFLSLFHLAFSVGTTKYQSSIIAAIALQSEDHGVYDDAEGGGFIRMDRPEMELT